MRFVVRLREVHTLPDMHRGGCQCGAVRYTLDEAAPACYACHCLECQKQSASAFAISVPMRSTAFDVTGPLKAYVRATDSGSETRCWFCEECGTRIYHRSAQSPEMITVKGGTLDDPSRLAPAAHLWVSRKQPWLSLPADVAQFETQPDDLKAWRDALLAGNAS